MAKKFTLIVLQIAVVLGGVTAKNFAWGRTAVDDETGSTVADASSSPEDNARKYFRQPTSDSGSGTVGPGQHYLAIGLGGFTSSDSYEWGQTPHTTGTGRLLGELTYRIAPLSALADWALRADLIGYQLPESTATQLAVSPILMFPDSGSKFPLYFGVGMGPGIFLSQLTQESFLALNYQLFAGIRFFDVLGSTGFFAEFGLKNQVLLLSSGQFNGEYVAVGAVFMF